MHIVDTQKSPKFTSGKTASSDNVPVRARLARKATEIDMLDGVVEMETFNQIIALDEGDATKEFSRTLVTAWCDQAQVALEEMRLFLAAGNITDTAHKAQYLKGSSASLGLIKVSKTCQSIYHLHFPPSLAQINAMRYSSDYFSSASSGSSSYSSGASPSISHLRSPSQSPGFESEFMDFETNKIERATNLVIDLTGQIKQASQWLEKYYYESDKFAART